MEKRVSDDIAMIRRAGGMEYLRWLTVIGKSRATGWRWRQPGPNGAPPRVRCCMINNRWYISAKEIERFWQRAEAGEFAGEFNGICAEKQRA